MIDDCFTIQKTKWGTWNSIDKEGNKIITSLTEESCINATRWHMKQKQEGNNDENLIKYDGVVSGKL